MSMNLHCCTQTIRKYMNDISNWSNCSPRVRIVQLSDFVKHNIIWNIYIYIKRLKTVLKEKNVYLYNYYIPYYFSLRHTNKTHCRKSQQILILYLFYYHLLTKHIWMSENKLGEIPTKFYGSGYGRLHEGYSYFSKRIEEKPFTIPTVISFHLWTPFRKHRIAVNSGHSELPCGLSQLQIAIQLLLFFNWLA